MRHGIGHTGGMPWKLTLNPAPQPDNRKAIRAEWIIGALVLAGALVNELWHIFVLHQSFGPLAIPAYLILALGTASGFSIGAQIGKSAFNHIGHKRVAKRGVTGDQAKIDIVLWTFGGTFLGGVIGAIIGHHFLMQIFHSAATPWLVPHPAP